ncbi:MAG: TetR/AcrR family transcriptional regulator [Desulfobulbaceae bacterium]|nr:TetR/AcrR family transcriptional regulator [Desulfobulbaceae bacterium]
MSPTNTFRNLQEDKQRRITAAAVHEFAEYGFKRASVNRIVKETGIAKGSLYQYFIGKEALYLHVFTDFIELVKQTVKENETTDDGEVFSRIRFVINAGLQFIKTHPEYFRLYTRLLSEAESPCRAELLAQVRFFPIEYFEPLIRKGQDEGLIRTDVSVELIVFMIDAVLDRFLLVVSNGQDSEGICPDEPGQSEIVIDQIIRLLEGGMAVTAN